MAILPGAGFQVYDLPSASGSLQIEGDLDGIGPAFHGGDFGAGRLPTIAIDGGGFAIEGEFRGTHLEAAGNCLSGLGGYRRPSLLQPVDALSLIRRLEAIYDRGGVSYIFGLLLRSDLSR